MKKALLIIGIIIGLFLVITAIMPSSVHVERSIDIEAPIEIVFDQVSDLKKNFNWSPWAEKDPNMEVTWGEKTSGLDATYSWKGNDDVGSGTLTVVKHEENKYIENALDFGDMGLGTGTWKFEEIYREDENGALYPASVTVTWGMDSELGWPIGRIFGPFMDDWVGADFESGLANLKEVCEAMPVAPKIEVMEVDYPAMRVLTYKDSCSWADMETKIPEMMGMLVGVIGENYDLMAGPPMIYYHKWDEENQFTVMVTALPVIEGAEFELSEGIELMDMAGGRAAKVSFVGPYDEVGAAHYAIDEWIDKNGKEMAGVPFEQYMNDPAEVKEEELITDIYYPIL